MLNFVTKGLCLKRAGSRTFSGSTDSATPKIYKSARIWGTSNTLPYLEAKDRSIPFVLESPDGTGFRDISLGVKNCSFITGKGDLYSFGSSATGQLGIGEEILKNPLLPTKPILNPTLVEGISDAVKVSCGFCHTAVITSNGELYTFGYGGRNWSMSCGGLGHGDKSSHNRPKKVEALAAEEKVIDMACGNTHTLVCCESGKAYSFGEGEHGRLGTGGTTSAKYPVLLKFFLDTKVSKVFAQKEYSLCVNEDGTLYSWGRNDRQQLGLGGGLAMDVYSCESTPMPLDIEDAVVDMGLSQGDCLAVTEHGDIFNWGDRRHFEPISLNALLDNETAKKQSVKECCVSSTFWGFVLDDGSLWTANKKVSLNMSTVALGHGPCEPFREPKRVEALAGERVGLVVCNDEAMACLCE